ncbi:hypothetical protein QC823_15085 [Halomonas vilamensis]|uniref:Uncharacterized protein n=1 Tax=Vreelandella vilamensis TaxID=531309 RepID=A0ABU1H7U6_9GAMM|nr:hypothetical protein [Halomonas vilamensis]MDR5900294.1 hypothetical protein [Halomonas vilamensis]
MLKVELRPLDTNQPGYGQLVIIGWQGTTEGLSIDIQRNQDEHFLQKDGAWGNNAFKFHLPALQPTTEGYLAAEVDCTIVDPLLENSHATNMVRLYGPDDKKVGQARLRIGQGLMPSGASGSATEPDASADLNTPQPPPVNSKPEPTAEPPPASVSVAEEPASLEPVADEPEATEPESRSEPNSEPPKQPPNDKSKRWLWILLAVVILTVILGAAAWFGMSMRDGKDTASESEAITEENSAEEIEESEPVEAAPDEASEPLDTNQSATSAAAAPCSLQRMSEMGELEFVQACTGAGNDDGGMLDVVNEALTNDHCGIARRLYAHQALNGDADAALAYAQEFDPAQHSPSTCFPEPDTETAIFWYETALGLDPNNAEASQRLEELQG